MQATVPEQLDEYTLLRFDTTLPPILKTEIKSVIDLIEFNCKKNPSYLFCTQAEGGKQDSNDVSLVRITFQLLFEIISNWIEENVTVAKRLVLD